MTASERKPADGVAIVLHLINAARAVTKDYQSEIDPRDFHRLVGWVDDLDAYLEAQRPAVTWEPRKWRELIEGDRVRAGGIEAEVKKISMGTWYVDPKSSEYRPIPLEHEAISVQLSTRQEFYHFPPDNEVETLRGPRGQAIDAIVQRHCTLAEWARGAVDTLRAAGLDPQKVGPFR